MKKPSLDRILSGGHYELANCRFIEQRDNASRRFNPDTESRRIARLWQRHNSTVMPRQSPSVAPAALRAVL